MKVIGVLLVLLMSTTGCGDRKPSALEELDNLELTAARSKFQTMPIEAQIEIVSWELMNRRPASSRFDFLLSRNGPDAGPELLSEATKTESLTVNVTMLMAFSEIRPRLPKDSAQFAVALDRCYELAGEESTECDALKGKLDEN